MAGIKLKGMTTWTENTVALPASSVMPPFKAWRPSCWSCSTISSVMIAISYASTVWKIKTAGIPPSCRPNKNTSGWPRNALLKNTSALTVTDVYARNTMTSIHALAHHAITHMGCCSKIYESKLAAAGCHRHTPRFLGTDLWRHDVYQHPPCQT